MKTPGTFTAQFHGICAACGIYIVPGESCAYNEDGKVVHARICDPYTRRVEQRSAEVCTTCWLTKPCECDE